VMGVHSSTCLSKECISAAGPGCVAHARAAQQSTVSRPRCAARQRALLDILAGRGADGLPGAPRARIGGLHCGEAGRRGTDHARRKHPAPGRLPPFLGKKGRNLSDTLHGPRRAEPARLARRVAALVYDLMLLAAVLFMLTLAVFVIRGGRAVPPGTLWFQLCLAAVVVWFFTWFWVHGGQTLGMKAWRLRVVRTDG